MSHFFDTTNGTKQPEGYTVWVCECSTSGEIRGTHHVSYHQGTVEEAKKAAQLDTAIEWYNDASEDRMDGFHILGVCAGNVQVIEWDEGA
tara:strand:- start:15794 stop:16063 length:270 start_codon:yes stop_codon:yes gene_type:complete